MDFAIIKTGGKQYLVSPGDKVKIEKVDQGDGQEIIFDQILLLNKNNKLQVGAPLVKDAKVRAKVLRQDKNKKVIVFKYKSKKRYKVKKGHRQPFTEVKITEISN